ncbi:1-deoxy-D-xylulose-5-phosphate synthase [bacterium]|nr:MAG: 1-deoxy-D-xylulose-5-phosphate synthase [bacterium]
MKLDADKYPLLSKTDNPDAVKQLRSKERTRLVRELRDFIIENVARTGGHLAPSLGVIELTVALLSLYSPPYDKIIWDVGHQAYAYKILTGRRDRFDTIRQHNGLSGFPKISESEYDAFGVGHASTSIGAAMGMAVARDMNGRDNRVIAVIGDGALTGGLAFEGLNNAGASGKDLLVILNDNEMSISKNVGALNKYLTEIIAGTRYRKLKDGIWDLTGAVPLTDQLRYIGHKLEDSIKSLVTVQPGMLFEGLGFDYFGPIDGHDTNELIKILHEIDYVPGPKLLHILTKKGKGYEPAESDSSKFHGISCFDPETGEKEQTPGETPTYTKAFGEAMLEMAEEFPGLCAITAAMEIGTGLSNFHNAYPKQFFDVGIAEGHCVLFGASLRLSGIPTVVAIYSSFLQRALDQIIHDVALQDIPLVIALDRAGVVGEDGPTHHGAFDLSYLRGIPNIIISAPRDEEELRHLLFTALSQTEKPFIIRYPRGFATGTDRREELHNIEIGSWETIREGEDIALLAVGSMVQNSLIASEMLAKEGIDTAVINARFVKPIDAKMLDEVLQKHSRIATLEENALAGGFGESISTYAMEWDWNGKVLRLGIPERFVEHATREELLVQLGLDPESIVSAIKGFLS